jgi:hypothetical protein
MTTWYSVNGQSWDDVRVGDRISISHPGLPPMGIAQELGISGNVTRLDETAVELNAVLVIPKEGYSVNLIVRQDGPRF